MQDAIYSLNGLLLYQFAAGIDPRAPATYLAVALTLAFAALLASFLPAHRATRLDPMRSLQSA